MQYAADRQAAHEFRDESIADQIFGLHVRERVSLTLCAGLYFSVETERLISQTALHYLFQSDESSATDKENVGGVDGKEFLVRMLASALRRHVGDRAFQNLQEGLLHAFARHVASNRRVLILATNLVDFIDVDDALLGAFDVA